MPVFLNGALFFPLARAPAHMGGTPTERSLLGPPTQRRGPKIPYFCAILNRAPPYTPWKSGAPEEIRTPDPQIRSLLLYAAIKRHWGLSDLDGRQSQFSVVAGPGFGPIFGSARNGSVFGIGGLESGI